MASFTEAVSSHIESYSSMLNTMIPAKVLSYDPVQQKCIAQPLINVLLKDGRVIVFDPLEDIPVIFPSTSRSVVSFPMKVDDTVMLLFSQRSIDKWLSTNDTRTVNPEDFRKHDLSDAVAVPGLFSFPRAINNPAKHTLSHDTNDLVIKHNVGTANENEIRLQEDGTVKISAGANTKITINLDGTLSIDSPTSMTVTSPTTSWTGDINVTGTVNASVDVIGGGKSLKNHVHSGSPSAPSGPISNTGAPV